MTSHQQVSNGLRRFIADMELAQHGLAVEMAGIRSVKVTRNGRYLGIWRQTVGSFDWYPAGYNQPQLRVPTPEQVARYMITKLSSAATA